MFLSADIVGSTAYKQRAEDDEKEKSEANKWLGAVLTFYRSAQYSMSQEWEKLAGALPPAIFMQLGAVPELWKTIGDEVVFTKLIEHPSHIETTMLVWAEVLEELRSSLSKHGLDVKSACWLADFPCRNKEIVISQDSGKNIYVISDQRHSFENLRELEAFYAGELVGAKLDYVGPSIDLGFRLCSFATPRKLIVSVELAHCLASIYDAKKGKHKLTELAFRYDGAQPIKGVLGGEPYPIIWLDASSTDHYAAEDALLQRPRPDSKQMLTFTDAVIAKAQKNFCYTHISSTSTESWLPMFSNMPVRMREEIQRQSEDFRKSLAELESESFEAQQPVIGQPQDVPSIELPSAKSKPDSPVARMMRARGFELAEMFRAETFRREMDE